MSLGGMTVYGLISHTCCEDGRISAAIVMAGVHDDFPGGRYVHQDVPVLLLHGDADVGYHNSRERVRAAGAAQVVRHPARRAALAALRGPARSGGAIVDTTTVLFWNRYLKGDTAAAQRDLVDAVQATKGKATLQRDLS